MDILVYSILKKKFTDLLTHKADLDSNNKVVLSQLPDFVVAQVIEVQTYADLPATGSSGYVYNVKNDADSQKNGSYRWVGNAYVKYSSEANYYNVTIVGANATMGDLKTTVDNINLAGQHVFFDMHSFITDGHICTIHFFGNNQCEIYDVLNATMYGVGQTYTSEQLVSNYIGLTSKDLTQASIPTSQTITLTSAGWLNKEQTIQATGIESNSLIMVSPIPTSLNDYAIYGVYCYSQGSGTLTFKCGQTPTTNISVGVIKL